MLFTGPDRRRSPSCRNRTQEGPRRHPSRKGAIMKAIVYTTYGPLDVLQLQETEKPAPKDNEVLVRVHAASANAVDWRQFTMPAMVVRLMRGGLREPTDRSFGVDVAGRVEAVGANVKQFQPGDEVFGLGRGAFAEYVC